MEVGNVLFSSTPDKRMKFSPGCKRLKGPNKKQTFCCFCILTLSAPNKKIRQQAKTPKNCFPPLPRCATPTKQEIKYHTRQKSATIRAVFTFSSVTNFPLMKKGIVRGRWEKPKLFLVSMDWGKFHPLLSVSFKLVVCAACCGGELLMISTFALSLCWVMTFHGFHLVSPGQSSWTAVSFAERIPDNCN